MNIFSTLLIILVAQCQVQVGSLPFWSNHNDATTQQLSEAEIKQGIAEQLDLVQCPARSHLQLTDYWNCLWRSSVNADDLRERMKEEEKEENKSDEDDNENPAKTGSNKSRKKRATTVDRYNYEFVVACHNDMYHSLVNQNQSLRICQNYSIRPEESLKEFVWCLRVLSQNYGGGASFHPRFNPPGRIPIISTYDERELPILKEVQNDWVAWKGPMSFRFKELTTEDVIEKDGFGGADPYHKEQFSVFRYNYDNIGSNQRQPGWSFGGASSPSLWHQMNIRKFYTPLISNAKLSTVETYADFAQAYPGLGELAEHFNKIEAPLDYRWTKDTGFHVYTRYLLPLLTTTDVEYYKYKNLLPANFKVPSDSKVVQGTIDALNFFMKRTNQSLTPDIYPTIDDVPFNKVYEGFMEHYYYADTTRYLVDAQNRTGRPQTLYPIYDLIRHVYRGYVRAVIAQLKCTKAIVDQVTTRRAGKDIQRVLNNAKKKCIDPIRADPNFNPATQYVVGEDTLKLLYNMYFDRKESRQRYTLPLTPVEFPICKHNEPSPIDINTKKGRKSSLTSYKFGDAAYRLNRFFIMFPTDGSTLLSVGMVKAERLDGSSIWLSGGAVKGQRLTFQTMLIRFGRDWKSQGSEHLLDSKAGQMELQMIFTTSGSADELKYWQVLASVQNRFFQFREKLVIILSVLVDALPTEQDVIERIEREGTHQDPYLFEPFAQAAYYFRKERETHSNQDEPRGYVSIDPLFRFIDFIPKTKSRFYTYRGSLSWPPCFGYVIWSVYQQRLYISKRQFDEFIKIPAFGQADHNRASDNFRLMKQIYVEEEHDPNLAYEQRQNLVKKRTVDRHILEGIHDPDPVGGSALVDEAVYYLTDDNGAKGTGQDMILPTLATLSSIYANKRQ
ncbi:unnamed protein product [Orchesella dallaii]|uniref:carbonic anhydrase n=1 Tax=Orchesella dallaii TaxID=48710 RepID=A0ABP1S4L8_9HEXA